MITSPEKIDARQKIAAISHSFLVTFCQAAISAAGVVSLTLLGLHIPLYDVLVVMFAGFYYLLILSLQAKISFFRHYFKIFVVFGVCPIVFYALSNAKLSVMTPAFLNFFPILALFAFGKKKGSQANAIYILGVALVYVYLLLFKQLYSFQVSILSVMGIIFTSAVGYLAANLVDQTQNMYVVEVDRYENYKLAIGQATNHIILTDSNGKILFANQAAETITGYSFSEMSGNTPRLWGGMQKPEFYKNMWKTIKTDHQKFSGMLQNRRKNGEVYTAITHIAPILNEQEALIGFIGAEEDVSKMVSLESQLAEDKKRDEALLLSLGEGVVVQDKTGVVTLINGAALAMLGYERQEILGESFVKKVKALTEEGIEFLETERPLFLASKNQKSVTEQLIYRRKDNSTFESEIVVTPVYVDGTFFGDIQVFKDISKEKQIDREKTEFISLASHQLRTPLTAINWFCETLLSGDLGSIPPKQKEHIEGVYAGSQRMVKLVSSLLNVSRIETGTFLINPEPVDVLQLIHAVVDESAQKVTDKKLAILIENDEIPIMQLDPNLATIIFQNLLTNAIKYTPAGGQVKITLKIHKKGEIVENVPLLSDTLLIEVSDSGIGIPSDQQKDIFKKLFRADNARSADQDGTGLGLYLVKSLIEHNGGRIWFKSTEGKGSVFSVTLPLCGMIKKEGTKALS